MKNCELLVNKIISKSPSKYKSYCFLIQGYMNGSLKALDTLEKIIDLFQDNNTIIEELNKLLPISLKVPAFSGSTITKAQSELLNRKLQDNFKRMKETDSRGFQNMLEFLANIHQEPESTKHDKFMNYLSQKWPKEIEIMEILKKLIV